MIWAILAVAGLVAFLTRPRRPETLYVDAPDGYSAPLPLAFLQRDERRKRPRWGQTEVERERLAGRRRDAAERWERRP